MREKQQFHALPVLFKKKNVMKKLDEIRAKRVADCVEVEMRFNGDSFLGYNDYNSDFNVHHTELLCSSEEQWEKIITGLREELQRRKTTKI